MSTLNRVVGSYRFINICRRAFANTTVVPPPLFPFHQQDFKAHFIFLATVEPSLLLSLPRFPSSPPFSPFSFSYQVPQLEVKSLAIPPPQFWPLLPSSSPYNIFFSQHLPHSAFCLAQSSSFSFFCRLLLTRLYLFHTHMTVSITSCFVFFLRVIKIKLT